MKNDYLNKGRVNQKLETREKILNAAQYFLNEGTAYTLEQVAEKAGISRATIYRYYSSVEMLAAETILDMNVKTPEQLYDDIKELGLKEKLLGVQDYFNGFAQDNENAFRNYLSIVLSPDSPPIKRGGRRIRTLKMILNEAKLNKKDSKKLQVLLTILMGIEPLIVTKDVCGLNNKESTELLKWGMELILKGISIDQKE